MKAKTIAYWAVTALVSLGLLGSGFANVAGVEDVVKGVTGLGYPAYFPAIIGVWKIGAALAFLAPGFGRVKEWAYAGVFFLMSGAFVSHIAAGDPIGAAIPPLMILAIAVVSYVLRPQSRRLDRSSELAGGAKSAEPIAA